MRTDAYNRFATKYGLFANDCVAMPGVIENAAQKADMAVDAMISEAMTNEDLGKYLATCCKRVAADNPHICGR